MDSFLTLSNPFKQFQSFNQIIPAADFKSVTLNSYEKSNYLGELYSNCAKHTLDIE